MKKTTVLLLSLSLLLCCSFLSGCNSKSTIFEKDEIRFFPSALYFKGNEALFDDRKSGLQMENDGTSLSLYIQYLAENENVVEDFYNEIKAVTIINDNGENVNASVFKEFNYESIDMRNVRDTYHLDGCIGGTLKVVFTVHEDISAKELILEKKDGTSYTLDCLIDVQLENFTSDKHKESMISNRYLINDVTGTLEDDKIDFDRMSNLDIDRFAPSQLHYNEDVLDITFDLTSNFPNFIIERKDPWRTTSYYVYIEQDDYVFPIYGYAYFYYYGSVVDKLI